MTLSRPLLLFTLLLLPLALCLIHLPPSSSQNTPGGPVGSTFSSDAFLSSLSFDVGTLSPAFVKDTTSYSLTLSTLQQSTDITFTLEDPNASCWFSTDGSTKVYHPPGTYAYSIPKQGITQLLLQTYASDSATTIQYQILIYRPPNVASDNANLLGVAFSAGTVTPTPFSSHTFTYSITLPSSTSAYAIGVTVSAAESNAYLQLIVGTNNAFTVQNGVQALAYIQPTFTTIKVNCIAQSARVQQLYTFNIVRSGTASAGFGIVGDPIFTGLLGQTYQIHGVDGEVYNLFSTPTLQINSQFVFLDEGKCPPAKSGETKDCWTHPGTYLGKIGIQLRAPFSVLNESGSYLPPTPKDLMFHRLSPKLVEQFLAHPETFNASEYYTEVQSILIESGPGQYGFDRVLVNGVDVEVGDLITLPFPLSPALEKLHELSAGTKGATSELASHHSHSYIQYLTRYKILLHTPELTYVFTNSDHFINQKLKWTSEAVRLSYALGKQPIHGLLGQTIRGKEYGSYKLKYIESGNADNYIVQLEQPSTDTMEVDEVTEVRQRLFGNKFIFNRFCSDLVLEELENNEGMGELAAVIMGGNYDSTTEAPIISSAVHRTRDYAPLPIDGRITTD